MISVDLRCFIAYDKLHVKHKYKWIIFKLSQDYKSVGVEREATPDENLNQFVEALPKNECRYGVLDFECPSGEKQIFFEWVPNDAGSDEKDKYHSSRGPLRRALKGVTNALVVSSYEDLSADAIVDRIENPSIQDRIRDEIAEDELEYL